MNGTYSPFGHPQARFDHLAALTNCRITGGYLRIPCPAQGGTDPNLSLWVSDDAIAAKCHSAGCAYADIAMAILLTLRRILAAQSYGTSSMP